MELRVQGGRAVLAGRDDAGEREVDPRSLPLAAGLAEALHEWAEVAEAVLRTEPPAEGVAGALVTRRGRQLAGRLAAEMGAPVEFTDPVSGERFLVAAPADPEPAEPAPEPAEPAEAAAEPATQAPPPGEPTPWGTGLTVAAFTAAVVTFTVVTLSVGLGETSGWLALLANVLVVGGIAPSVWLARTVPVWRWVAYGVMAGVPAAWFALLLTLL
ncbi:DUF2537 domain-containing protein [Saccharothrix coeruleofusca]|uniref:DUF2537 domain-containing protein n=1 Tax=Saccharothrix coeruleofusca TaxID=33919 RepID=A0A918AGL3_9PSEU|nr:DUF2537 domain-containing protein [Saccharothrix coeruleofusca]GGP34740.1 hypothetical protein GCM10010185_01780 [Saccharothrix coeruleofusca]